MNQEKRTSTYLSFKLAGEVYAINVSQIINILEMAPFTKVPKVPPYMLGVINLRGKVLPVIDLRKKLEIPESQTSQETCIIVVEIPTSDEKTLIGIVVDEVLAVETIEEDMINPAPSIGTKINTDFIAGVAEVDSSFIMLLVLEKIIMAEDILEVNQEASHSE